ncbi:hypothetical protein KUCAC02_036638 [Chaenocephalus aceratus]|nr:hypothetical protein KUCAC02_036638 [Chaenocephalus aceratus]
MSLEAESALCQLTDWQRIRDELQAVVSSAQDVMQINLLSITQSELRGSEGLLDSVSGRRSELGAALLEILRNYMEQFLLLAEIQELRSR